jgi:hypothetical protein
MTRSLGIACVLAAGMAQSAVSQASAVRRAAATITEADVRRRIYIIADDSMGGRDTPSPGLAKAAGYIASEFQRFGLKPGGDSGSYLLKYPIASKRVMAERSTLRLGNGSASISTTLAEGAALMKGPTSVAAKGSVVLVGGLVVPDSLTADQIRDRVVVYVPAAGPAQTAGAGFRTLQRFGRLGARAVVLVIGSDSLFRIYQRNQLASRTTVGDAGRAPRLPPPLGFTRQD